MAEKSLGDICHDAFWEVSRDEVDPKPSDLAWQSAAQAVASKVREETIEECCRAICTGCKRGEPVTLGPNGYYHGNLTSALCDCDASMLRSLKGKANDAD